MDLYRTLDEEVKDLRVRLGGLPRPAEAEDIWGDIWFQEAHNSTAIEGNTLVLREVKTLLREGRAIGNKALADYLEVIGYGDAAQWVYGQALQPGEWTAGTPLTMTEVRYVHALALGPVWEVAPHPDADPGEAPGSFRRHNIKPFGAGMRPPPWTEVPSLLDGWLADIERIDTAGVPIPEALATIHARFEQIHPFLDGNGRAGRLLLNLILIRRGYPPAIIEKRQRGRYLQALQRADAGDAGPLGELLTRAILQSLYRFIMPAMAGRAQHVPLAALADGELSANALYQAVVRGRLQAVQDPSGRWLSSRSWLEEYRASRSPRGRRSTPGSAR